MNPTDSRRILIRNRIIDLYLIFLSLILVIPNGPFHFVSLEPITDSTVVFSFIFPEFWAISIFGVCMLVHHRKHGWKYKNVTKTYFIIVGTMLLVYFCGWLLTTLFFPNLPDCLMSRIWKADPCTDVDFDGNFSIMYLFGGTFVFTAIFPSFPMKIANQRDGLEQR